MEKSDWQLRHILILVTVFIGFFSLVVVRNIMIEEIRSFGDLFSLGNIDFSPVRDVSEKTSETKELVLFDGASVQNRMNYILQNGVEGTKQGYVELVVYDHFEKEQYEIHPYIVNERERIRVYNLQGNLEELNHKLIRAEGVVLVVDEETEMVSRNLETLEDSIVKQRGEEDPNLGEQKTAVFLVNSFENPVEDITVDEVWEKVFSESYDDNGDGLLDSVNSWVRQVSYEKTWLTGDVFGWYTLSLTEDDLCDNWGLLEAVITASDPDVYFPEYRRLIIVMPINECQYGGISNSIGMPNVPYQSEDGEFFATANALNGFVMIDRGVSVHELGHGFGLHHANLWQCDEGIIGETCYSGPYGDIFDIMGQVAYKGHFSAIRKEEIGWFNESNILAMTTTDLSLGSSGIYEIESLEVDSIGIKVIEVMPPSVFSYSIEYRRAMDYDSQFVERFDNEVLDGAIIRLQMYVEGGDSHLLNMHPEDLSLENVVLKEGEVFFDPQNSLSFMTIEVNNSLWIAIGLCGDGVITPGEDCEGLDLNDNTCRTSGFREGFLSCNSNCRFDTSLCVDPICPESHEFGGGNSCIATLKSDITDGALYNLLPISEVEWDTLRHYLGGIISNTSGSRVVAESISSGTNPHFLLIRASIPFNTSSLPDGLDLQKINSAVVVLEPTFILNTHPNSNDFITLVPTTLANPPILSEDDFDQIGSINNPVELAERADISQLNADAENEIVFELNEQGKENINTQSYSSFGLRAGYDLFPETPNSGEDTDLYISFPSYEDQSDVPTLIVNYSICVENNCIECFTDNDCPGQLNICQNNECVQQAQCVTDSDCTYFQTCQEGYCLTPCHPNDECIPQPSGQSSYICWNLNEYSECIVNASGCYVWSDTIDCPTYTTCHDFGAVSACSSPNAEDCACTCIVQNVCQDLGICGWTEVCGQQEFCTVCPEGQHCAQTYDPNGECCLEIGTQCNVQGNGVTLTLSCPSGVHEGVVVEWCDYNEQCHEGSCVQTCTETDGGIDYYQKGRTTFIDPLTGDESWADDVCYQENMLREHYCQDGSVTFVDISCNEFGEYACENGACIERCALTTATWDRVLASEGMEVSAIVWGNSEICANKIVHYDIYEDDLMFDDFIDSLTWVIGQNLRADATWEAERPNDGFGDPELYFVANLTEEDAEVTSQNLLTVIEAYCGNGIPEFWNGEQCDDGNTENNDGCNSLCEREFCGDNVCQKGEEKCPIVCVDDCYAQSDPNIPICDSFLAGTKITLADGSEKNIEDVEVGEEVLSYDVNKKKIVSGIVAGTKVHDASGYYVINDKIKVTGTHPFFVNGKWKKVKDLTVGDQLMKSDKSEEIIDSISPIEEKSDVYNIFVENTNTYFADGVLVHNKQPCVTNDGALVDENGWIIGYEKEKISEESGITGKAVDDSGRRFVDCDDIYGSGQT